MKSGANSQGFTIVETLIFLGISAVITVSVLSLISGSQNKAMFQQAVYDTDQQINDVIDNVINGYYNKVGKIQCTASLGAPNIIDTTDNDLGSNTDCIFIGKVIRFGVENKEDKMTVYDVVGRRLDDTGGQVITLNEAKHRLIAPGSLTSTGFPDASDKRTLKGGLSANSMQYGGIPIRGIAILTNFAQNSQGFLKPAVQQVKFYAIKNTNLTQTSNEFVDSTNDYGNLDANLGSDGIKVCFNSGTTKQHADITIGGTNNSTKSVLEIKDGSC